MMHIAFTNKKSPVITGDMLHCAFILYGDKWLVGQKYEWENVILSLPSIVHKTASLRAPIKLGDNVTFIGMYWWVEQSGESLTGCFLQHF